MTAHDWMQLGFAVLTAVLGFFGAKSGSKPPRGK